VISSAQVTTEKKTPLPVKEGPATNLHRLSPNPNCDLRLTLVGYPKRQNDRRTGLAELKPFVLSGGGFFFYCASNLK